MTPIPTLLAALLALQPQGVRAPLPLADFEGADYGGWAVTGTAFGPGPARGALPGQMVVEGFQGKGLVNSFSGGDRATGALTSPSFTIERRYLSFLIGGGGWPGETCLNLIVEGKVARTATGPNTEPGGSERLQESGWDVRELEGERATLEIVDRNTGGWGHINVDQIMQTDDKPRMSAPMVPAARTLTIASRYLHFPIQESAPARTVSVVVEGKTQVTNSIKLADAPERADWWAFLDVSALKGKALTLQIDKLPEDSRALALVEQGDAIKGGESLYREPLRPQLHFSSRRGWLNDPNGLVFYNGEYHLFYQHNPYSRDWGNMHWGHATSRNLVNWREHGDVLSPDDLGPMFSGSAVVDGKNTSGFGKDGKPPLVLIYTAAGNPATQCLAYSADGRTFTKFQGNPVVPEVTGGNRDPKVFWHEATRKWVMALYVELPGKHHSVHFFTSPNLREWKLASVVQGGAAGDGYLFECPDFFELPVDDDPNNRKWVLTAANSRYSIGTFDGATFTPLPECTNLPDVRGQGFYAAQTFSDAPDGKRIQIGWIQASSPGMSFNQLQSLPIELTLKMTERGIRLIRSPLPALQRLREGGDRAKNLSDFRGELVELRAELIPGDAESVEFDIRGVKVVFDAKNQKLRVNDQEAPAPFVDGKQRLTVYLDRTVAEVYASGGQTYLTLPVLPDPKNLSVRAVPTGGKGRIASLKIYRLKSAWKLERKPDAIE